MASKARLGGTPRAPRCCCSAVLEQPLQRDTVLPFGTSGQLILQVTHSTLSRAHLHCLCTTIPLRAYVFKYRTITQCVFPTAKTKIYT